jgi:hypothetical protein
MFGNEKIEDARPGLYIHMHIDCQTGAESSF